MSANILNDVAKALLSGSIKVVDLTAPLGPDTPVLYLDRTVRDPTAGNIAATDPDTRVEIDEAS